MKYALLLLFSSLLAFPAELAAQPLPPTLVTATVPVGPTVNVDRPFPGGIGRYQQWFSANSLATNGIEMPRRLTQVEFFAGTSLTSTPAVIDCEFLMGYGNATGLFGNFDSNYVAGTQVVVKTRANVQLSAGGPGAVVMTVPFNVPFTWDRVRPVVLEIRIYGNSLSSQPFNYNFQGTSTAFGVSRMYTAGSALAASGSPQTGFGMRTRFTGRLGVNIPYGVGCAGEGGIVPTASVSGLAWPASTWTHTLSNAASQRLCLWSIGDSKTDIGGVPLPVDIAPIFGGSASNCFLRHNAVFFDAFLTVGGGAGGGTVSVGVPLPPTTGYVGLSLFTQWVVLDPLSSNGAVSTTSALESIVSVVGG